MKARHACIVFASSFALLSCAGTPSAREPLTLVRFQHSFEKNIVGATAEYSLRKDGKIQVLNSGFKKDLAGAYTKVEAVARVPDSSRPGALRVKFFGLFDADYLIFGLDAEHYSWALVGNNSRDFLWLLARTPEIDQALYDEMVGIARQQGYAVERLFKVPQKQR
jgi:apolipoprotein D and lipocalin family protein